MSITVKSNVYNKNQEVRGEKSPQTVDQLNLYFQAKYYFQVITKHE